MESGGWKLQRKHWDVIEDDDCRLVLAKMQRLTLDFVDGKKLASYMINHSSLTEDDLSQTGPPVQMLQLAPEDWEVNKLLLTAVSNKGKDALRIFMDGLLETEQQHVYDLLLAELQNSAQAALPCYAPLPSAADATGPQEQEAVTGSSGLVENITASESQLLLCPVCRELMIDPVLLPCVHTCCRRCLPEGSSCSDEPALVYPVQVDESRGTGDDAADGIAVKHFDLSKPIDSTPAGPSAADVAQPSNLMQPSDLVSSILVPQSVIDAGDEVVSEPSVSRGFHGVASWHCPVCHDQFSGDARPVPNRHVASCIALLADRLAGGRCRRCADKGYHDVEGTVRCLNCACFMCDGCVADHNSFLRNHRLIRAEDYFSGSHGIARQAVPCVVHRSDLDFFCKQCDGLHCIEYVRRHCLLHGHNVMPMELSAKAARDEITAAVDKLWPTNQGSVSSTSSTGVRSDEPLLMPADVGPRLQAAYMTLLRQGKQALLDVIESVHEAARDRVELHCSRVAQQAAVVEALIGHVIAYCRDLVRSPIDACLIEQRHVVLAQLQRLQPLSSTEDGSRGAIVDSSRSSADGQDPGSGLSLQLRCKELLTVERLRLTDELKLTLQELIGVPTVVPADPPIALGSLLAMAIGSDHAATLLHEKDPGPTAAELKRSLSDRDSELSELRSQLDTLKADHDSQQQRRCAAEDELAELRAQLEQANAGRQRAEDELRAFRERLAKCEQQLYDAREAKSHVDCELKELRLECERLHGPRVPTVLGPGGMQLAGRPAAGLRSHSGPAALMTAVHRRSVTAAVAAESSAQSGSPNGGAEEAARYRRQEQLYVPWSSLPARLGPDGYSVSTSPLGHGCSADAVAGAATLLDSCDIESVAAGLPDFADDRSAAALPSNAGAKSMSLSLLVEREQQLQWPTPDGRTFEARVRLSRRALTKVKCTDVALASDGCLVLAMQKGIRILLRDTLHEVGNIFPDRAYTCLATLTQQRSFAGDGKQPPYAATFAIIAGNKTERQVELLVPRAASGAGPPWRIAGVLLQGHLPWCLAVDPDETLVAVGSGRNVHIARLDGSDSRLALSVGLTVTALAFTSASLAILVVASGERQRCIVEGRSLADPSSAVWQHPLQRRVCGLCCDRHDNCYVLQERSSVLLVLSAAGGSLLAEITCSDPQLHPVALAFDADRHWLAFLLNDKQTVALYEFSGDQDVTVIRSMAACQLGLADSPADGSSSKALPAGPAEQALRTPLASAIVQHVLSGTGAAPRGPTTTFQLSSTAEPFMPKQWQ